MEKAKILEVILPAPFAVADLRRLQAIEAHHEFTPDAILRLHVLVPHADDLGSRLRLSNEESDYIARLRGVADISPALRDSERRAILYALGPETWRGAVKASWARTNAGILGRGWRELHDLANRWRIPKFPVTGKDLMAAGLKPGEEMGATLRRLEDWWIASDFEPEKGELLAQLKS
jgi:poly(A) polymerase